MQEWGRLLPSLRDPSRMELEAFMELAKLIRRAHHC